MKHPLPFFSLTTILLLLFNLGSVKQTNEPSLTSAVTELNSFAGPVTNITQSTMHATIQEAVDMAMANDVIEVSDGGYAENVIIDKSLTLRSENGRATTTIGGSDNGTLGTVLIQDGVDNVILGQSGQGFTIIGFDNDNGAVEAAAVYLDGAHTNITIQDNEIRANGEAGLLSEFNAAINNIVIDNNLFSGQTFSGLNPDGIGFSTQFNNPNNVPRQLVVMGGGDGVTNSMNVTFTNNNITGVAGGISSDDFTSEQGNTLVTIDVLGATITDNNFMGTTTRFGSSLRVRGDQTVVKDNIFSSANLGDNNSHIFFGSVTPLGFANASDTDVDDLEGVMLNNTFDIAAGVFNSITPNYLGAITGGAADEEVLLLPDTYTFDAQVVIDENRTIRGLGTDKSQTILNPTFNTGSSLDSRGWFLVNEGFEFGMENLTLDGTGFLVYQAVRHKGFGTFDNVRFTEIKFNESGPTYQGTAIAAFGTTAGQANVNVTNSMFDEIGRVGVLFFGTALDASSFTNNMYTGKGTGDFLDYAADISAGANVTVSGNTISGNKGTASSDGSKSAGMLVSTFFAAGTTADITDNTITDNTCGVTVGFNNTDASTVSINNNDIFDNTLFGVNSTNPIVDASNNWWGDASGPSGEGPGTGDAVSENVMFCPWLTTLKDDPMVSTDGFITNLNQGTKHCTIQDAVDNANPNDVIEVTDGTYNENVTIDRAITLQSVNGAANTIIQGSDNGVLGTLFLPTGVNDVTIGGTGIGFTINGFDNDNGAVETAAIYLQGAHENITIQDNEIVADGEAGLLSEFNADIDNIIIENNIFSGQTFAGAMPDGIGFSTQFNNPNNVPRQLVVMGGGDNTTLSTNVTFTNNKITGVAGGISSDDGTSEQGNTLVTIDVVGATITDNNFMGITTRFGASLRARGEQTIVKDNIFSSANLGENNSHIFFGSSTPFGFENASDTDVDDLEGVMLNNIFDVAAGVLATITPNYLGAITAGAAGEEVLLLPDTYTFDAQVIIDEDRTIRGLGTDKSQTILNPTFNTGSSSDSRGWFLVNEGFEFGMENLTVDGTGFLIYQAVRHKGFGTFDNVRFTEIKFNESGPTYQGTAIAAFGTTSGQANVNVTNSMFDEIGRIGVLFFGAALDNSSFTDNMYTGKGTGDFLDYAVDISAGANVTVSGNTISENKGTASSDGSKSAGMIVSTFFGAGTTADITDNIITDNTCGVTVGFNNTDASTVSINNNDIFDNTLFGVNSTNPIVDASNNWWGDASGPSGEGPGTGDAVSENVMFCPWLTAPKDDPMVSTDGFITNTTQNTTHCTIQDAVDNATAGDVIELSARTYEERVTIDKSLTLQGATNDKTMYVLDGTNLAVGGSGINILANVTDVTITNLTVQNYTCNNTATQAGISAQGNNNNLTVQNVKVDNNLGGRAGLYANGPVNNVLFDQVMAMNHKSPGFQRGIVIWNGHKSNITISNCMASNNACCGIELQDGTASGVNIINNTLTDNADNGIGLTTLNGLTGANVVSGNTVTDCGRFGIEIKNPEGTGLDSGIGSIVVENNNVSFTASAAMNIRDHAGIAVFRRSLLAGNSANYPDVPTGVIVRNNTVSGYTQLNPSATTSEGFGIVIEGTNHTVSGNTIEDNDIGLQLQGGGHPDPNYTPNDSGDGNQNDGASPNYFGRGNAPVLCEVTVGTNTFTNNTTDKRLVTDDVLLTDMMDIVASAKRSVSRSGDATVTYCTIQDAIDAASAGETVTAAAGLYVEDVTIDKAITLEGPNQGISPCDGTRVEAAEKRGYINITANGVTIDGLDFVDGKQIPAGEKTAIQIVGGVMNTTIQNSSFIRNGGTPDPGFDAFRGIINEIGGTTNLTIDENSFSGWHTGIYLQNADETDVTNNCIDNNMVGISSDNPIDVDINNNDVTNNQFEGIGVGDNGTGVSIEINNNNITGNLTGLSNYSSNGLVVDAESNWWGDAAGPDENNTGMPGNGDIVNETPGEIDFCPWLDDEVGTGVLVPGPMAVTRDIVIALDASGNATITASQIDNGSTNGCDEPPTTLVLDITTFDCDDVGDNTVTLTITDEFGRMDMETATVTIVDNAAPLEIECSDDITVDNDAGECTAVVNFDTPEAYDIAYFESFEAGFVANTYSSFVEFNSAINTVASGTDGITSTDGTMHAILNSTAVPPSSSTGAFTRMNGYTTEFGEGYRVSLDVYMDLDDPAVIADTYGWDLTSAASRQDGSHLRDFIFHTASNAAGNILVGGSNNTNFTRRNDLASINNYEITTTGWYTFEWIFRDDAGVLAVDLNLLDASGMVLFTETRSTPADDIATTVGGNRYTWFTFLEVDELAIDNNILGRNLEVTCDATSGDPFPVGTTTVTCMATDACGNEVDCSFDITVNDAEMPVLTCPTMDVEVNTDAGTCEAVVDLEALVSVMDNCDTDVDLIFSPVSGSAFVLGATQVTVTATDDAGNMSSCMFNVVVKDMEMPTISCPSNVSINADANCEATLGNFTSLATVSDNCSANANIAVTQDPVAGSTLSLGDNTIKLIATDEAGNMEMCTFIITVEDNTAPTISCPSELTLIADANCSQATAADFTGLASVDDNCDNDPTVTQNPMAGSMLNIGANIITLTVEDDSGNLDSCKITVNVVDNSDPIFTSCAPDVTVSYDADCEAILADYTGDAVAEDNCNVTITQDPMPGTMLAAGETMVTLTATDDAGNMATCMFTVTVPTINTFDLKVFLEGAYDTGTGMMRTDLNDKRLLPGQQPGGFFSTPTPVGQPYNVAPWNYMGDEGDTFDSDTTGTADAGYDSDVVDWVLVSLRSGTAANTTLCQQAGLLYDDGTIQFPSGCNCTVEEGEMVYVVVEHRNHLAVMSDMQVAVGTGGTITYDFTTQNSFTTGFSSGQKEISSGVFVMFGGNGDQTTSRKTIDNSDLAPYINSNGNFNIYIVGDYDIDGNVNLVDEVIFSNNNGTFSAINF